MTAPPGVGKSRLSQELLQELRARGEPVSIWTARGDVLSAGSPFAMLGQALRSACGVREGDPLEARRAKISATVEAYVTLSERRRVAEFLGEIAGAPFPDEDSLPLRAARRDAQLMADQARAAFLDFMTAACARGPVLVLLEDLHWGDRPTVQLIDAALRESDDRPLFVLALARPNVRDVFPKLWEGRRVHEMRLVELHRRAGERLARHVLGQGADAETIARIVRLSEGNAFYLEELIRWTAEGKDSELPETVVAMVESRLGALDDEARRLLRAASVFGEVLWPGGVAALLGGEARRTGVVSRLDELVERELLLRRRDSRFSGEEELSFRHALLREGAYAMLTDEDRRLGHRLAGEWLEAHGEPDARMLAEHFEKGGDGPSAGRHYANAAHQAYMAGDAPGAAVLARRGLALPLPGELRAQLLGALCEASIWQIETVVSVSQEAEELVLVAPRGSSPWIQGMLARFCVALMQGQIEIALALVRELRQADTTRESAETMAFALLCATVMLDLLGHVQDGSAALAQIGALKAAFGDEVPLVATHFHSLSANRGGMDDDIFGALRHARMSQSLTKQSGHAAHECSSRLLIALNAWFLGAADEAERLLRELEFPEEKMGLGSSFRPFILAWILADRGALGEARSHAEYLVALGRSRGMPHDEGRGRWVLAEVLRRAGDLDAADREIAASLALLRLACPLDVPGALATLAAIRTAQGRPVEAVAAAEEGLLGHESMRMCSQFFRGAFLRLNHVESLEAAGKPDAARAALAKARDRLLAISDRILDPSYRIHFLEDVPENRRTLALAREWLGEGVS